MRLIRRIPAPAAARGPGRAAAACAAGSEPNGLVAQPGPGEGLLRSPQDQPNVKKCPQAVRILRQGSTKGAFQLVLRIRRVIGVAPDACLDFGQPVPVGGEGGAISRLDSLCGGRMERAREGRLVIETYGTELLS